MDTLIKEYTISVLGGKGAGKTSYMVRLVSDNFLGPTDYSYDMHGYESYRKQSMVDDVPAIFGMIESVILPHSTDVRALTRELLSMRADSHGYIIIFDVTNRASFVDAITCFRMLERLYNPPRGEKAKFWDTTVTNANLVDELVHSAAPRPPVILLGNKSDLSETQVVTTEEAKLAAEENYASFFEISVKRRLNIDASIQELIRNMRKDQLDSTKPKGKGLLSKLRQVISISSLSDSDSSTSTSFTHSSDGRITGYSSKDQKT